LKDKTPNITLNLIYKHIKMEISTSFVHHVFFWLNNPESKEDLEQLVAGLKTLTQIEEIQSYHIGIPAATNRAVIDASYSISWLNIFSTAEDQEKYQNHPIHLSFVENCSSLWKKVQVYDSVVL
jgi:Stress responsive A/B Barrel Domain